MLRVIAGLLQPDAGTVVVGGRDITHRADAPAQRRAWCSRTTSCSPTSTSPATSPSGCGCTTASRAERRAPSPKRSTLVGLDGFDGRRVDRLSGGEAKRVALARSLAPRPAVLLLDEPFTGLDRDLHDRLALDLAALLRTSAITAIIVTHDPAEAAVVADRVVHMT